MSVRTFSAKSESKDSFKQSKLYEILCGVSKQEYKEFGLFIRSPYYNKSKMMEMLYDYFKTKVEKLDSVNRNSILDYLFGGKEKVTDENYRKIISDFTKLVEEFLIVKETEKDVLRRKTYLLVSASQHKLNKSFTQTYREVKSELEKLEKRTDEDYLNELNAERLHFLFKAAELKFPEKEIQTISTAADYYFISVKLLLYYDILNLRLHYHKDVPFDEWVYPPMFEFLEKNKEEIVKNHPGIYGDFLSVRMLEKPDDRQRYDVLKKYVVSIQDKLAEKDKHKFYIYLYNHSIYMTNRGVENARKELFDIIKIMDKEEIPVWNFFGFHIYFQNAVTNACTAKEFEWAEDFMKRRRDKIQPDVARETYNLSMANMNYLKGDLNTALKYILSVDFSNYSHYLYTKSLLIKIYYELNMTDGIIGTIDAMRHYITRAKSQIPERLVLSYSNFINCVSKLVGPGWEKNMPEVQRTLAEDMTMANREWLIGQLKIVN